MELKIHLYHNSKTTPTHSIASRHCKALRASMSIDSVLKTSFENKKLRKMSKPTRHKCTNDQLGEIVSPLRTNSAQ